MFLKDARDQRCGDESMRSRQARVTRRRRASVGAQLTKRRTRERSSGGSGGTGGDGRRRFGVGGDAGGAGCGGDGISSWRGIGCLLGWVFVGLGWVGFGCAGKVRG